jgi:hypothetical protein
MKITYLRLMALAFIAAVTMFVAPSSASAAAYVGIRVGNPPPPPVVDRQWQRPYHGSVWVAGHYEWVNGGWFWVRGYYTYPPRHGATYVPARYRGGYYYGGHWNY